MSERRCCPKCDGQLFVDEEDDEFEGWVTVAECEDCGFCPIWSFYTSVVLNYIDGKEVQFANDKETTDD